MSRRNPTRFLAGLVLEVTALAIGVSLLPRFARSPAGGELSHADQRPSLVESPSRPEVIFGQRPVPSPIGELNRTPDALAISNPPADPAYVEQRLDEAGQQLLTGVSSYLHRTASELLQSPAPTAPTGSFSPPTNPYRY